MHSVIVLYEAEEAGVFTILVITKVMGFKHKNEIQYVEYVQSYTFIATDFMGNYCTSLGHINMSKVFTQTSHKRLQRKPTMIFSQRTKDGFHSTVYTRSRIFYFWSVTQEAGVLMQDSSDPQVLPQLPPPTASRSPLCWNSWRYLLVHFSCKIHCHYRQLQDSLNWCQLFLH